MYIARACVCVRVCMCVCVYISIIDRYTVCNSFRNYSCPSNGCLEEITLSDTAANYTFFIF